MLVAGSVIPALPLACTSMKYTVSIQIETITRRDPADLREIPRDSVVHFDREIVTKGMWSAARERLTEASPDTTLWVSESEYRFSGLLMRLVGLLMPGAFRKQSQQHMQDFKAFAEQGTDVREAKGRPTHWRSGAATSI